MSLSKLTATVYAA